MIDKIIMITLNEKKNLSSPTRRVLQNSTGFAGLDGSSQDSTVLAELDGFCRTRRFLQFHHPFGRYTAPHRQCLKLKSSVAVRADVDLNEPNKITSMGYFIIFISFRYKIYVCSIYFAIEQYSIVKK